MDLKGLLAVEILMTDLWICCVQLPIRIVLLSIFISRSLMFHSPPFVHVVRMCVPPMVGNMLDLELRCLLVRLSALWYLCLFSKCHFLGSINICFHYPGCSFQVLPDTRLYGSSSRNIYWFLSMWKMSELMQITGKLVSLFVVFSFGKSVMHFVSHPVICFFSHVLTEQLFHMCSWTGQTCRNRCCYSSCRS